MTTPSNAPTLTTTYYYAGTQRIAVQVSGSFSYLATDALGNTTVALGATGAPTATTLYAPYGSVRYTTGTMPTDYGFTGQRNDAATGLDYYGARYYDPLAQQFASADTAADGLNRYGYVHGNPERYTDPTGHRRMCKEEGDCEYKSPPPRNPPPHSKPGHTPSKGTEEPRCSVLCRTIRYYFTDSRTQAVLMYLMQSPLGAKFVEFFVAAAEAMAPGYYIRWDNNHPGGGYTNWDGSIQIDPSLLPQDPIYDGGYAPSDLFNAATTLVHEGVESFYALAYDVRSKASQHMDYVADYYAGWVGSQLSHGSDNGYYGSSFAQWDSGPGKAYAKLGEPLNQPEVTDFWGILWSHAGIDEGTYPNGMGLSLAMLTASTI